MKNFIKKLLGIDELEEKFKSTYEHAVKLEKQLLDKDKEITDLIDALSEVKDTKKQIEKEKNGATRNNEPWVKIIDIDFDGQEFSSGAFELDWNDIFVAKLVKAGYSGKSDAQIVEQWFNNICRTIVLETYEQEMANTDFRTTTQKKNIGKGLVEFS